MIFVGRDVDGNFGCFVVLKLRMWAEFLRLWSKGIGLVVGCMRMLYLMGIERMKVVQGIARMMRM